MFDDDDDLFSRPPRTTRLQLIPVARITCRVCNMRAEVTIDNEALLCQPCRVDTVQTRLHVEQTLASIERRWQQAVEAFDIRAEAVPEWRRVEAARLDADPALFAEAWRRRKAAGGPLAELLTAKEALDELSDEVQRQRGWAASAFGELDAYENVAQLHAEAAL